MRKFILLFVMFMFSVSLFAQRMPVTKANYSLAARFSPKKIDRLVFSTSVDPHW